MGRTNYTDFQVGDELAITGVRVDCLGMNASIHSSPVKSNRFTAAN